MNARKRLDQRGFARAVVAQQAMHFAALQTQGHAVQRDHAAEELADVFQRENGVLFSHDRSPY